MAVSGNPRDPDDFACVHMQIQMIQYVLLIGSREHEILNIQYDISDLRRRNFLFNDVSANHQERHFLNRSVGLGHFLNALALPHHHNSIRNFHYFVQLVSDDDDTFPHRHELLNGFEQFGYFQRGQHRGRFVKDDDVCILI
ncbi:hypothetical protein SDC9_196444 [bioreactor metagenome]|uniref:Uncharacterized protein n=1 Tax=bioreactor metagenome TaxID=1076179 RepID=A0A645IDC9_9ZZZZ